MGLVNIIVLFHTSDVSFIISPNIELAILISKFGYGTPGISGVNIYVVTYFFSVKNQVRKYIHYANTHLLPYYKTIHALTTRYFPNVET